MIKAHMKYHVSFLAVCESILAKAQNFFLYLMRSLSTNQNKVRGVRVFPKVNLRLWGQNAMLAQVVQTVYLHFKQIVKVIGCPDARFHDLRHSYAVAALQSGDDIKTVQENLGHHTAAFTLSTYAHATSSMKHASANRMDQFIKSVSS